MRLKLTEVSSFIPCLRNSESVGVLSSLAGRNVCNMAYARARVGKVRYTKEMLASQAIRTTYSSQATTKKRRPEIFHNSQHGPHTTRKGTNGHVPSYIIMYSI